MGPPQREQIENGSVPDGNLIGRCVGPYEVLSQIGTGGMGEVYLARDTKLDRHVAVKLLAANVAADPIRLRRFHDEARAASALNHPNILIVHDFGAVDGRPYMVTEFVEGETVRARLERGPMGIQVAIDIALQVVSALAAAHGRGIVHRDIKPENVMLRPDGYVKVLDFGLAKLAVAPDAHTTTLTVLQTLPGIVLGTPQYMSPEQARGLDLDGRTDLWSLGVMMYEMIAGIAPFGRATAGDCIAAILREDPSPPRPAATLIPRSLEQIVMKTLQKSREERWRSASELYAELGRVKLELDLEAHKTRTRTGGSPRHTRERVKPRKQRVKALAVLPLQNLSGNANDEYFSDGMTEALIASLAQLSALRVTSRTSAMRYKSGGTPLAEIARELGVDVIVEGSVLALEAASASPRN